MINIRESGHTHDMQEIKLGDKLKREFQEIKVIADAKQQIIKKRSLEPKIEKEMDILKYISQANNEQIESSDFPNIVLAKIGD